jgi:hypothetical protein
MAGSGPRAGVTAAGGIDFEEFMAFTGIPDART